MHGRGYAGQRVVKGGKWDNCNSIINKIFFKKEMATPNYGTLASRIFMLKEFEKMAEVGRSL